MFTKSDLPVDAWQIPTNKDLAAWEHLKTIELSSLKINSTIDILIGNNVPAAFAPIEVKTGPIGSPFATKTLLGWIVWGITRKAKLVKMVNSSNYTFVDIHLEKLYRQSLDYDFPKKAAEDKREWSWEDRRFVKIMNESCILINGHYQVDLPLRDPELKLPNNKKMAEDRLKSLMKKMIRIPQFKDDYVACMEDMISKGHAEEVSKQDAKDGQEWYIPHHGVYHPRKPEKIRVVFDCAAKYRGTSLNDNLLPGPNLMNSLQGVLMRFRKFSVAFSSDIECMFYQVKVPDKQRDLLRFLWWQDGDITQKPRIYRKTVHLFGAASSPSCANYGLKRAALDNKSNVSKEAVDTVNQNFYMDDVLKSTESVAEAIKLVTELKTVCSDGGFNLTKWSCNRREVLEEIVTEHRSKELRNLDLDSAQLPVERTLGILWNPEDDVFQFQCDLKQIATSRRTMLSMASSIYDPLGFIAPLIIPAKIILQQMCRQKTGWDCQPDKEILVRWEQWTKNITDLNPRGISLETPGVFQKSDSYPRRRWRHAQYLVDVFWSRWKKEYLSTLQKRTKWQRQRRNVTVRDIVLIVDTAVPRNRWLLGVVEAVFRDNKGNLRVCRVRTKSAVLERPIAKLCVIVEVKDSE